MGPGSTLHGFWDVLRGPSLSCVQWCCWMLPSCPVPLHRTNSACAPFHSPYGFLSPALRGRAHLSGSDSHGSGRLRCGCLAAAAAPPLSPDSRPHTATCTAVTELMHLLSRGWGQRQGQAGGSAEMPMGCMAPGFRYGALRLRHHCHIPKLSSSASNGPGGVGAAAGTTHEFGVSRLTPPRVTLG